MADETRSDPQAKLLLAMVLLAFLGQMMLNPLIASLSRAMGLQEWQIGAAISTAALALALLSQFWERRSQRLGVKRTLVVAMLIALCGLVGFSVMAIPGYTAGPTLSMSPEEQGGLAGLINANNGITYAIAPITFTTLYGLNHTVPFVGILGLFAAGALFTLLHPAFLAKNEEIVSTGENQTA